MKGRGVFALALLLLALLLVAQVNTMRGEEKKFKILVYCFHPGGRNELSNALRIQGYDIDELDFG
jgi:hypothetical protein